MYNLKKMIFIMLSVVCVFGSSIVNAEENHLVSDKDRAINVLLNSGWTENDIEDLLTEDALLEYKNAQPAIASEKRYFKVTANEVVAITENECQEAVKEIERNLSIKDNENSRMSSGETKKDTEVTNDGYMEYYVQVYKDANGEYILSARYEWLTDPNYRKEDVFALGHSSNLTQISESSVYYIYKYNLTNNWGLTSETYEIENTTPTKIFIDDGGTAVTQDLADTAATSSGSSIASNHRGFIQYRVERNSTTATSFSAFAEYLHQEAVISVSPSVSFPAGGSVSVTSADKFNRMSPNPYVSFNL